MRRRGRNPNANPGVRPVTKIELEERSPKKRIVLAISLLIVGLAFLGYAIYLAVSEGAGKRPGWVRMEPVQALSDTVAEDMVFLYELGGKGMAAKDEYDAVSLLYTEACRDAFCIFSVHQAYDDVKNLYNVNQQIGEAVEVDPALYQAFELLEQADSRLLFAAPFYREYGNLFGCEVDGEAALCDPRKDPEVGAYFDELAVFTASSEHIRLELLGNYTVRLVISDTYRAFADENGIETFVDFYWSLNAFAVDYIAERLIEKGYTHGSISSYDGFVRAMDRREENYSYHLYAKVDGVMYDAARMDYAEPRSVVCLRAYRLYERDRFYYTYANGDVCHPYVDVADGRCKNALDGLVAYAKEQSCAEILLAMLPTYVSDDFDEKQLSDMKNRGIFSAYANGTDIHYNDAELIWQNIYRDETVTFRAILDE